MDIYIGGPTAATLKRSVGAQTPITFGTGSQQRKVYIDGIMAVGYRDLPISLPLAESAEDEKDGIWLVMGTSAIPGEARDIMVFYVPSTRVAVMTECDSDSNYKGLDCWFAIRDMLLANIARELAADVNP